MASLPAEYIITLGDVSQLEAAKGLLNGPHLQGHAQPRIAMVGRSNVGKSSLINALLGGRLAQVSNKPGKTRCIHFYLWHEAKRIVADLPGYGFAKASHSEKERWAHFINAYLKRDQNLERALVLLDARHGPTAIDLEAIEFLASVGVPLSFVFTKTDSLKNQSERARRKKEAAAALEKLGCDPKDAFWVSATTRDGINELRRDLAGGLG